jgi:hypothetical protein
MCSEQLYTQDIPLYESTDHPAKQNVFLSTLFSLADRQISSTSLRRDGRVSESAPCLLVRALLDLTIDPPHPSYGILCKYQNRLDAGLHTPPNAKGIRREELEQHDAGAQSSVTTAQFIWSSIGDTTPQPFPPPLSLSPSNFFLSSLGIILSSPLWIMKGFVTQYLDDYWMYGPSSALEFPPSLRLSDETDRSRKQSFSARSQVQVPGTSIYLNPLPLRAICVLHILIHSKRYIYICPS